MSSASMDRMLDRHDLDHVENLHYKWHMEAWGMGAVSAAGPGLAELLHNLSVRLSIPAGGKKKEKKEEEGPNG